MAWALLALNIIEIIDRNLYERSCDVRWWATDSAVVNAAEDPGNDNCAYASSRLDVILKAYTVYLDIWVVDANGKVLANGKPEKYPTVKGSNVSAAAWFQDALRTRTGDDFAVAELVTSGGAVIRGRHLDQREPQQRRRRVLCDGNPRGRENRWQGYWRYRCFFRLGATGTNGGDGNRS